MVKYAYMFNFHQVPPTFNDPCRVGGVGACVCVGGGGGGDQGHGNQSPHCCQKVPLLKPGAGGNIALNASPTARTSV